MKYQATLAEKVGKELTKARAHKPITVLVSHS